jgi:hypothetical protein
MLGGLSPEAIRADLAERFGDPHRVGVAALADPAYGPRLRALGARSLTTLAGPIFYAPPSTEAECWGIVAAFADDLAADAPEARLPAWPPLPSGVNSFPHGKIEKAVRAIARGETGGDVAREAGLPPADQRRVRVMHRTGLLPLNAAGKLVVDDRVARKGSKYVLRYLDEGGTRWLDPLRDLQGR